MLLVVRKCCFSDLARYRFCSLPIGASGLSLGSCAVVETGCDGSSGWS
jgi:hypothetical protein